MKRWFTQKGSFPILLGMSTFLLIVSFGGSLIVGAADITPDVVWQSLKAAIFPAGALPLPDKALIIQEIRLPREVAALIVGAALAISGGIMQGLTRNPLADPGLLGLSSGSGFAVSLAMALFPSVGYKGLVMTSFAGAALGAILVFGICSLKRGGFSPFRVILAGAALSALFYALSDGLGLIFKISKEIALWRDGGLVSLTWNQLFIVTPFLLFGILLGLFLSKQLTVISISEEVAVGLGQNTFVVKALLFICIILLAGGGVALAGNLVFLGLLIPHVGRSMVGTDYRKLLPISGILGASFLLLADTIGRTVHAPYEMPTSAVVALFGLPFFLFILRRGGKVVL